MHIREAAHPGCLCRCRQFVLTSSTGSVKHAYQRTSPSRLPLQMQMVCPCLIHRFSEMCRWRQFIPPISIHPYQRGSPSTGLVEHADQSCRQRQFVSITSSDGKQLILKFHRTCRSGRLFRQPIYRFSEICRSVLITLKIPATPEPTKVLMRCL